MDYKTLIALIDKIFEEKVSSFRDDIDHFANTRPKKGPRGVPGKDFDFLENQSKIDSIIKNHIAEIKEEISFKFSDLTQEEKESLKLKFSDLEPEDRSLLKGPRGQRGKTGEGFKFKDHKEDIEKILSDFFNLSKDSFKLRFSDLTDDEKSSLKLSYSDLTEDEKSELKGKDGEKGPRGQRGKPGLQGEKGEAGEKGDKGDPGEKGPRGQRGKAGIQGERGEKGEKGEVGPRGIPGVPGVQGIQGERGLNGSNGRDGKDAPVVVDIDLNSLPNDEISFTFKYSDGSEIETDPVKLPRIFNYLLQQRLGGGGGGGSPEDVFFEAYFQGTKVGDYNVVDYLSSYFSLSVTDNKLSVDLDLSTLEDAIADLNLRVDALEAQDSCIDVYDEGSQITDCLKTINFVGEGVTVETIAVMADWPTLSDVDTLSGYEGSNPGSIVVNIPQQEVVAKLGITRTAVEPISQFQCVRLVSSTEVAAGSSDTENESKISGIALNSANTGEDVTFVMFGILESPAFTFPVLAKLFLQSDGTLGTTAPTTVGKFIVVTAQSLGTGAIFIKIEEPEEIQ